MNPKHNMLRGKFSELLGWERSKRRERTLVCLGFYALLGALLVLPVSALLRDWISPWLLPLLFFIVMAPFFFFAQRWRLRESHRALARMDNALHLDARGVTAWEILARAETKPTELLVLKEAEERLKLLDAAALFPRQLSWEAYVIAPLFVVWFGLLWFDGGFQDGARTQPSRRTSIAQKLGEFSRELQEKAKAEGLRESLNVSRELEKVAQKRLEGQTADEPFKTEVAEVAKKITDTARGLSTVEKSSSASETQEGLRNLKTELEVAKDSLSFPESHQSGRDIGADLFERLAGLPHLKREIDKSFPQSERLGNRELKSFFDKLEREVTGELDRRALLDTQRFLEQLLKEGQGQIGDSRVRAPGLDERDFAGEGEKERPKSNVPGTEPGRKEGLSESPPQFQPGAGTHLKGLLGEGKSAGVALKGKPSSGKAELAQDDLLATYRRQAEAELNTERVPEGLKTTVKNYFLSLGMGEGKK